MDKDDAANLLNDIFMQQVRTRIVPLITGLELSLVHLINSLHRAKLLDRDTLAESYRAAAEAVPEGTNNRDMIASVPLQIAAWIEKVKSMEEAGKPADIRALLQLIPGGLSEPPQPDNSSHS